MERALEERMQAREEGRRAKAEGRAPLTEEQKAQQEAEADAKPLAVDATGRVVNGHGKVVGVANAAGQVVPSVMVTCGDAAAANQTSQTATCIDDSQVLGMRTLLLLQAGLCTGALAWALLCLRAEPPTSRRPDGFHAKTQHARALARIVRNQRVR